jgi:hypothetical protein
MMTIDVISDGVQDFGQRAQDRLIGIFVESPSHFNSIFQVGVDR